MEDEIKNEMTIYLENICKTPLLTIAEEKKYGKQLKLKDELDILQINNITKLDCNKLFLACENNSDYQCIINDLIAFFIDKEYDKEILEKLQKYLQLANQLNRALNKEELKTFFNIKEDSIIDIDLKDQVKKFILFKEAYDMFFKANTRLVVSEAGKFKSNFELLELISVGNIGLSTAILKYDIDKETKFSTCAFYWINQSIGRFIRDNISTIRTPEYKQTRLYKYNKELSDLEQVYGRALTVYEISKELDLSIEKIEEFNRLNEVIVSIDESMKDGYILGEYLELDYDLEEEVTNSVFLSELLAYINELRDNEKFVLAMRYGLNIDGLNPSKKQYFLLDIANMLNISRQRVNAIEKNALFNLRLRAKTLNKGDRYARK